MASKNTLTAFLKEFSQKAPNSLAIVDRDTEWSYQKLESESKRVAQGLANLGVGYGDRVGLWLPNVGAYLALFFACARLGAILVSVNTRYRSGEVGDIVGRSGCKVLVLWPSFKGIPFIDILADVEQDGLSQLETVVFYEEAGGKLPASTLPAILDNKKIVSYENISRCSPLKTESAEPETPCLIFTTSGTTSAPKFVVHPQRSIVIHARQVADRFGYNHPQAVMLQTLPFCGAFGFTQAMATLASGRPMINMPVFNAEQAIQIMKTNDVTHTNGSDEMFDRILQMSEEPHPFPKFNNGGYAAFNPNLENIVLQAEARGMKLRGLYGMSEIQALFSCQPLDLPPSDRARAGGIPVTKEAFVRARDPETGKILDHGEQGELEIQGPSQMLGYFENPEANEKTFTHDGYVITGDLGYTEANRGFVFLSRMGDVLRLGGFLVSPTEIESRLQSHSLVLQAQVVGVNTEAGSRSFAFVTLNDGEAFDETLLKDHCAKGLAKFKIPITIVPMEKFPVTEGANGVKIQRGKLRKMAQAQLDHN